MKRECFVSGLAVAVVLFAAIGASGAGEFTRDNWTEKTGFKPEIPPGFKAGEIISADNADSLGEAIADGIKVLVKKYGLKLWTRDYEPIAPSDRFIEATNKYYKRVKIIDTGKEARKRGMSDYVAGLPFPNPQDGLQVAWNFHYSYSGDDGDNLFAVYWISAKTGVERWEEWRWLFIVRVMHRTDIEPIPEIPSMARKDIQYTAMTTALKPFDKKGFTALYSRFEEPRDQEGFIYIPSQRRATRFSFGTRGDAWNNTDLLYEDVRGYMGYPEWMHWKLLGKKTILAPMHAEAVMGKESVEKTWDFKTPPYWNPKVKWEPRPVYVVEAIPKFPDYPYSKMICYIDAESNYMLIKEAYDRKGQLWKILINILNSSPDPKTLPPSFAGAITVDIQAEHATAFPWFETKNNVGLDPEEFSLTSLRKLGK